jgi:hypothetical protein
MSTPAGIARVTDGVWIASTPVRIVGMKLASNMTVLRLSHGELLLHSPVPMTPELRVAVEALGRVAHLYAPNTFHHLWMGEWASAFPDARVHAPSALKKKRPDLRIDRAHDLAREPAFEGVLRELHIDGFRLEETVLSYEPARALVVADLVHQIGRPDDLWTVLYSRAMGFYDRVALSRVLRWTAFSDRKAARKSLDALLDHPFESVLVGHGAPVLGGAREALAAAYAWLPAASSIVSRAPSS